VSIADASHEGQIVGPPVTVAEEDEADADLVLKGERGREVGGTIDFGPVGGKVNEDDDDVEIGLRIVVPARVGAVKVNAA
jgi:hypothetical protein